MPARLSRSLLVLCFMLLGVYKTTVAQNHAFEVITADNVNQLEQIGSLGTGYSALLYYSDDTTLTMVSDSGIWGHEVEGDTAPSWEYLGIPNPIKISPNERWVIGFRGELWDRETDMLVHDFGEWESYLVQSVFSADSQLLATHQWDVVTSTGQTPCREAPCFDEVILWDLERQESRLRVRENGLTRIVFVADGTYLAVMTDEESRFYETQTGRLYSTIPARLEAFSADSWTAVSWQGGARNREATRELTVWNIRSLNPTFTLNFLPRETLTAASLNVDGTLLSLSTVMVDDWTSYDFFNNRKTIAVWNLATGGRIATFEQDTTALQIVEISPNGRFLIAFSYGNTFFDYPTYLYDLWTYQSYLLPLNDHYDIVDFEFSSDGQELALLYIHGRIELLHFDGLQTQVVSEGFAGYVVDMFFDDSQIITTTHRGGIFVWDSATFALQERESACRLYAHHPSGLRTCEQVNEWEVGAESYLLSTGTLLGLDNEQQYEAILKAVFSPDGKTIAATTSQGAVVLWDTETGEVLQRWDEAMNYAYGITFTSDGRYLIGGIAATVWDMQTYEQVTQVSLESLWHSQFTLSESQDWLAFPTIDGNVYFWKLSDLLAGLDASQENAFASFQFTSQHHDETGNITFPSFIYMDASPDGRLLALTGEEGIMVYDVINQKALYTVSDSGNLLRFSPDGRLLIVGNGEWCCGGADESAQLGYARIWGVPSTEE